MRKAKEGAKGGTWPHIGAYQLVGDKGMMQVKKLIRRVGSPAWKRIRPSIYTRIDWRIDAYLAQITSEKNRQLAGCRDPSLRAW